MHLSPWDFVGAGAAAAAAGMINALAGGGTLVSFPALVAIGVPAVPANITNTVSLVPGYLAGSWAQRDDLRPEVDRARLPVVCAAAGGLAGSILLVLIPGHAFRVAVPYLILLSCALLAFQDRIRAMLFRSTPPPGTNATGATGTAAPSVAVGTRWSPPLLVALFLAAAYGGFFGAGLGIMLLAVLGLFTSESLQKLNGLKQALSFFINLVAAFFFAFSGHVVWELVPVMAVASLLGGTLGGRLVQRINALWLRRVVVVAGLAVAISFWVA